MVRQVRLELTIPCLRGRCLNPIWLLTRVIADFQLPIGTAPMSKHFKRKTFYPKRQSTIANRQLAMSLAGLTRLELAISASTVQRFNPTKLQPRDIADCQMPIFDFDLAA
jgi:hypothetical protein